MKKSDREIIISERGAVVNGMEQNPLFCEFIQYIDRPGRTTQTYITNLRQFAAWLLYTGLTMPDLTRNDVIAYREYLISEHDAIRLDPESATGWSYRTDVSGDPIRTTCKASTAGQYLGSAIQFIKWAGARGLCDRSITENIHKPKTCSGTHKREALRPADVLRIEKSIEAKAQEKADAAAGSIKDTAGKTERATEQGKRLRAMYLLAVTAGLRTIELERANVKDLEIIGGQAYIYIWGKGHAQADAKQPIAWPVYEAIREYLDTRRDKLTGTSPLFISTGNRSGGKRIAARTISQMLKKAMQGAGYDSERITAHSLRHTAGTTAWELTGGNLSYTKTYMRHANETTTAIYVHDRDEIQRNAGIANKVYSRYMATA